MVLFVLLEAMNSSCHFCSKTVYKAEERKIDSKVFHPGCLNKWTKSEASKESTKLQSKEPERKMVEKEEEKVEFSSQNIREIIEFNKKNNEEKNKFFREQNERRRKEEEEAERAKQKLKETIEQTKYVLGIKFHYYYNNTLLIEFLCKFGNLVSIL